MLQARGSRPLRRAILLALGFIGSAHGGGPRDSAGALQIPITGQVYQFDKKRVEIRYLKRVLIFKRTFQGLPANLEPRPDQFVKIWFNLTDWQKFAERLNSTPISKQTRIDLRETFP